jgi:membrane protein required for colicin V production
MNWVDLVVLAILALSAGIGLLRGFVREALGLAAWVGAALLAARLMPQALPIARRWISDDSIANPVAFLVVFGVLLVVFLLVAAAVGSLVRGSLLGGLDRVAGLVFGLARGAAVLVIAFLVVSSIWPVEDWPSAVVASRALPPVRTAAAYVSVRLPDHYRPDAVLPDTDTPNAAPDAGDRRRMR